MIKIYVSPSCSSCKKVEAWLKKNKIEFNKKNIIAQPLTKEEIRELLDFSENGFEDIISTRSKIVQESGIDFEDMTTNQLIDFIIENPTVMKRPIIIDDRKMQVGFNPEDIDAFLPKHIKQLRQIAKETCCDDCNTYCDCDSKDSYK